jgi:hypothetical protein
MIEAKVDGWAGLSILGAGFVLQVGGYAALIGGVEVGTDAARALVSLALAAVAASIYGLAASRTRRRRLISGIVGVAKCTEDQDGNPIERALPSSRDLALLGRQLGFGSFPDGDLEDRDRTIAYAREQLGIATVDQ